MKCIFQNKGGDLKTTSLANPESLDLYRAALKTLVPEEGRTKL